MVYCACLCVTSAYRVWPRACGTVLQMALVIAARYSELPPESAAARHPRAGYDQAREGSAATHHDS